jgi:prefoldin beta subunit
MAMTQQQMEQLLMQAQVYQQQMQNLILQKETLKMQELELRKASDELGRTKETSVYKISGTILIKTPAAEVANELKEKQETIATRMLTLEKSEKTIQSRIEDIRKKLGGSESPDDEEPRSAKAGG